MIKAKVAETELVEEQSAEKKADSLTPEQTEKINKMMGLGVFYGRSKARTNPKMRKYILTNRSGFGVINLEKTLIKLERAKEAMAKMVASGGTIMFVGTSASVKETVQATAKELGLPYITERWLGGMLTNFGTITKRIKYFRDLKDEKKNGEWDKYTKKEELKLERELMKLDRLFSGVENLDKLPDMVFVADVTQNNTALREARKLDIPIVAILNTDADPDDVDYAIPANEKDKQSADFILGEIRVALEEAKAKMKVVKEVEKKEGNA